LTRGSNPGENLVVRVRLHELIVVCAVGCQEVAPARLQVELPELVLSPAPVKVLVWRFDERNQRSEGSQGVDFTVTPSGLAIVDGGRLTCKNSGDGKLSAAISDVANTTRVRCRLVDHLEAPSDLGRIEIAEGGVRLDVGAYSKDGQRLDDVPLKITTKNTRLARAEGDQLLPLAVGEAKVEVRAGDIGREFDVQIVRRLKPEPIPIDNDTRLHFTLDPGRYELVIELESEKKLSAEWRRAPYCNYSAVAKVHTTACLLQVEGGVAFDNPAYLNSGAKTVSHDGISLHQIGE
jgi:hypothetical protein